MNDMINHLNEFNKLSKINNSSAVSILDQLTNANSFFNSIQHLNSLKMYNLNDSITKQLIDLTKINDKNLQRSLNNSQALSLLTTSMVENKLKEINNLYIDNFKNNFKWINDVGHLKINPTIKDHIEKITQVSNHDVYKESFLSINSLLKDFHDDYKFDIKNYDFSELIDDYEDDYEDDKLIVNPKQIILDESYRIKDLLFEIYLNNEKLYKISPREFEKVIAELLNNNGFDVELTKQTRDNGYDILALKYVDNLSPIKYLVECKRFRKDRKIGVDIVRSFKEVLQTEHANKGLIVTSSYFTKDAIKKQKETPYLLDYKDKDELMTWVKNYYVQNKIK